MESKVSIIIPTYNGEKYIKETIESCLNQTYPNVGIIVIDDCSNDNTANILKEYGEKIRLYLNETNQGISRNVNKGVNLSEGEYFILLGHDDILPDTHIEIMLQEFDSDTVAVHCNSILIDGHGDEIGIARNDNKQIAKTDNCLFELSIDNFISSCGMLHRMDIFKRLNGWDEQYKHYGEWLYYIKELQFGKIKYTTKTKAFYRRHETNITNTFKNKKILQQLSRYKDNCKKLAFSHSNPNIIQTVKFFIFYKKLQLKNYLLFTISYIRSR